MLKDALYTNTLSLSCIFFLFPGQSCCQLSLFFLFSWALTLPLFFSIFFSFDFLGLMHDSLFLFLLDVIFFGTFLFL